MKKTEYLAKVVNNDYFKKKNKKNGWIQIRVPELHWGIENDDDLPWAKQDKEFSSMIPEIGDVVVVYCLDTFFKKWFYQSTLSLEEKHQHTDFENNIKSAIGSTSEYPNTKYLTFANKVTIAFDSSLGNPEISLYNPTNTYIFLDKNGNVKIKASGKIEYDATGGFDLKTGDKFSIKSSSGDLKALLEKIVDTVKDMKTIGSPALHTIHPADQSKLADIKSTDIANLLT